MVLVSKELNRLGELAESLLSDLKTAIVADGDSKTHGSFIENLEIVHQLQDSVTEYITRLFASGNLTEQQSEQTAGLLYVNNSIQRIADRCEDIDQICEKVNNNGKRLTSEASSEMEDCIDIIQQLLKKAGEAVSGNYRGIEGVLHYDVELLKEAGALILYASLISGVSVWRVVLLVIISLVQILSYKLANNYELKHRDAKAKLTVTQD